MIIHMAYTSSYITLSVDYLLSIAAYHIILPMIYISFLSVGS